MSRGPRGRMNANGLHDFGKIDKTVVKRLLSYIFKDYKKEFILVIICILFSSIASVSSSLFLETLIDDYIEPMIGVENPVWTGLIKLMGLMGVIYLVGIVANFVLYSVTSALYILLAACI